MDFDITNEKFVWYILGGIFLLAFLIQGFYYLRFYIRLLFNKSDSSVTFKGESVSIVICARDKAEELEINLPLILEQDYYDFEVVVVNDCSDDNTEEVLNRLKLRYKNLRSTYLKKDDKFFHGKKLALTIGLKAAVNDWVILTEPDCKPASTRWVSEMLKHSDLKRAMVIGYSRFERSSGFLDKISRYDNFYSGLKYLTLTLAGYPYMGTGKNLAYRKELFFNNRGFASHLHLTVGDDDLLVNEVANGRNCTAESSCFSHTVSPPTDTFKKWVRYKQSRAETFFHYRMLTRFSLLLESFSILLFYILFVILLVNSIFLPYVLGIFIIRMISGGLIIKLSMNRLKERGLFLFYPLFDPLLVISNFVFILTGYINKRKGRWKRI